MKKVVLLIVVLVGALLVVNHQRTGRWTLAPSSLSAEERHLRDLEDQLRAVEAQMSQAGRAASIGGMDTTADVSTLLEKKQRLEKQIAEARKKAR
jgi:hypothetical protein